MKNSVKMANLLWAAVMIGLCTFTACDKEEASIETPKPIIEHLEIGSGNNKRAIIGRDFHLDMDIKAAAAVLYVQIKIEPKAGETYSSDWRFEKTWEGEFRGHQEVNVHKHFDIPENAAEGNYDFIIIVHDENGGILEMVEQIELIHPANLPVDPKLYMFMAQKNKKDYFYILNRGLVDPTVKGYSRGDTLTSYIDIQHVKDDGVLYLLLIDKSLNYRPESANNLDFSKVIVADKLEHKGLTETKTFSNYGKQVAQKELVIGSAQDNNSPQGNNLSKSWKNGDYLLAVIYTNSTNNLSVFHYVDCAIDGF